MKRAVELVKRGCSRKFLFLAGGGHCVPLVGGWGAVPRRAEKAEAAGVWPAPNHRTKDRGGYNRGRSMPRSDRQRQPLATVHCAGLSSHEISDLAPGVRAL